jgi:signal transduction histidine kinase
MAFVSAFGVIPSTLISSGVAIISSTVLCHLIYFLFEVPVAGITLAMPTLAPAVIAPPMLYVLIRAVDLLVRAERELQDQRKRLQAAVETAQRQALQADSEARAKAQFLAHMSHELRTPLNAILGFSETIRDVRVGPIGTEAYREYAGHIHDSGKHLLSLINDILDMSRIESGKMDLECEWHSAFELAGECLALVETAARAKTQQIDDGGVPAQLRVFGDRRAIKQVLINLLSNAVKFTGQNGRIAISAAEDETGGTVFSVSDTGIGISPGDLERIYEPFVRLEHAESGTGLGLPLARGLVELHGGEMTIDSELGRGTIVSASFPPPGGTGEMH